jgi:hypothetical protein
MFHPAKIILLFIATVSLLPVLAQISNMREKKIPATGNVRLDSMSIVPNTISVPDYDTSYFSIDVVNAVLHWKKKLPVDSVDVFYRAFSFRLNAVAKRYAYDSIINNFIAIPGAAPNDKNANPLLNFGNLTYNGSFGRSLSFGNTQDAVFNSQFDLQLNGMLGDSIMLSAAITDNNIPVQPDGTTEQLNDFDKILLQFRKKNWEVDLGDIDLRQNQSYFLNFYTRLQGISYQQKIKIDSNIINKTLLSGAISKGKFAENILVVQEGNQGPYKLQGANNEIYFVVLAGTEKVYIDGVQMQRGQDQDYVINYNTAEVTFTPKQMITKDSRVQVDFEYADQDYLNSLLYVNNETDFGKKFILNFSAYSNVDAKNSPISQPLSTNQIQFLANLGDSVQNAFYPVASTDSFSATEIMYKKIDTIVNGVHDSIFVYSTNPDSAKYNLQFVNVGQNKGNYIPSYNLANGNVYQWVRPINGVPQGNYDAATFLVTPKKHQVITLGGTYFLDSKTTIKAEGAASDYDQNTFSTIGKENDVGYAGKFDIDHKNSWQTPLKTYTLDINAGYEYEDANFQPIERIHSIEFLRDWGLNLATTTAVDEELPSFSLSLSDNKNNSVQYLFNGYLRSDGYTGYRNVIKNTENFHGWYLTDAFNITNMELSYDKGYYLRPTIDLNKTFTDLNNYTIGTTYAVEHNELRNIAADTLSPLSFAFETLSAYIKSNTAKKDTWSFTYFTRSDQLPFGKNLVQADRSNNFNFQTNLLKNPHEQLRLNLTYRQLHVSDTTLTMQQPDNSLLGRAEYIANVLNGFIVGNALYEIGGGQQQKQDYSYVQVPAGQGQFTWIDYNHDGIAQLNEFVLALFPDQATYIRVYTPTDVYVKDEYNQFNYSVVINPKMIADRIKNKKLKNILTRFILQSSLQAGKKVQDQNTPLLDPFKGKIQDTSLIDLNYKMSNTLSFNRTSTNWGADLSNVTNYDKSLLTYGLQTQQTNTWTLKGRLNIKRTYTIELIQQAGTNSLLTPSFGNQNYVLNTYSIQPQLTYLQSTKFRVISSYNFLQTKNSVQYGGENAYSNSLNIETDYNAVQNTSITAKFTFNNINYDGIPNTTDSYVILNGLQPGKNYIWTINFTKRLMNNLELMFEYEGRKSPGSETVNIGRASLRALL